MLLLRRAALKWGNTVLYYQWQCWHSTVLENLSKSRIQLGERSELRLHFEYYQTGQFY